VDEGEAVVVLGGISAFLSKNFLDGLHAYLWRITVLELNGCLLFFTSVSKHLLRPVRKGGRDKHTGDIVLFNGLLSSLTTTPTSLMTNNIISFSSTPKFSSPPLFNTYCQ